MIEGKEVVSATGVVAAEPQEAARIGARVLGAGGNAMDAASATALAACMMRPDATGVAGYVCAALVLEGSTGRVWSVDCNAVAPASAHESMFDVLPIEHGTSANEREYCCRVRDDANVYGPLAVAAPGMLAGIGILWERWGRLDWPGICAPSQELVDHGFPFGPTANSVKAYAEVISRFEATASHLMPSGQLPTTEQVWHRPGMGGTLARIASAGWRDLYDGELGRRVADHVAALGGILTREDMAAFEPRVGATHSAAFRGAEVHGAELPNGSLTGLQILAMLDCLEPVADDEWSYWHRFAEVLKLAWRDRLTYLADPAFVHVPADMLLDRAYAMGRTEALRQFPERVDAETPPFLADPGDGTLHLSTADHEGNLVAMTISQGGAFGSCVVVPDTGLILGHGMFRFDPRPGRANSVEPGKRPLNNTCPLLVRARDRDIALGLPGGRRLIAVSARMAQQMVETGRTGLEAAEAPRMHIEVAEPVQVTQSLPSAVAEHLSAVGHVLDTRQAIAGRAHIAERLCATAQLRGSGNGWVSAPA